MASIQTSPLKRLSRFCRGVTSKTWTSRPSDSIQAFVLELVVLRGDGERGRLLFLGLHFGGQVARDDFFVDDVVAFEARHFVADQAERRDAAQGVQAAVLLQLGKRGVHLDFHGGALEDLSLRCDAVQ